jgi:hypothetical protein
LVNNPPTIVNTDATTLSAAASTTPYSTNRPSDKGIGYEVKSAPGYYEETAFATIPSAYRALATSGYLLLHSFIQHFWYRFRFVV